MSAAAKSSLEWWYQFYFATERGRAGYKKYRKEFSKEPLSNATHVAHWRH